MDSEYAPIPDETGHLYMKSRFRYFILLLVLTFATLYFTCPVSNAVSLSLYNMKDRNVTFENSSLSIKLKRAKNFLWLFGFGSWEVNTQDKETILSLSKISLDVYFPPKEQKDTRRDDSFGWDKDHLRGYIYVSENKDLVVVGIKGTSAEFFGIGGATSVNDKVNDNHMFSCCCAAVDKTWPYVCDCYKGGNQCNSTCLVQDSKTYQNSYFYSGVELARRIKLQHPNSKIVFTGHSLGGALSSLIAVATKTTAIVFESPGEYQFARRIGLNLPKNIADVPVYHFGHTADPVFTGECRGALSTCWIAGYALETKCHLGKKCLYDLKGEKSTSTTKKWSSNILHHRMETIIENVISAWPEVPECQAEGPCIDCGDWDFGEEIYSRP